MTHTHTHTFIFYAHTYKHTYAIHLPYSSIHLDFKINILISVLVLIPTFTLTNPCYMHISISFNLECIDRDYTCVPLLPFYIHMIQYRMCKQGLHLCVISLLLFACACSHCGDIWELAMGALALELEMGVLAYPLRWLLVGIGLFPRHVTSLYKHALGILARHWITW